jgi:hypothetical protein
MNEQQEREQFENQFAYPRGWRNFTRSEDGFYVVHDGALEAMWKAWQARAALAAQGVPADAIREVIRISDRSHPAWDEVKAWLAATPAPAQAQQADDIHDAHAWTDWEEAVLKIVREFSGYDGFDDADQGVDLPEEVRECLSEISAERDRAIADLGAFKAAQAQQAEAALSAAMQEGNRLGIRSIDALRVVVAHQDAAQAQQAAPLTVPHPGSDQASKAIDAELEARGWPSNTKNAARAGYEACRKLAGIGASSGSAA